MTDSGHKRGSDQEGDAAFPASNDPVLAALRQAEERYREIYAALQQENAAASRELTQARERNERLTEQLATERRELDQERIRAHNQRDSAGVLAAALKEIHRALFSGNIYELILKACLTLTGGTRGLYVTSAGQTGPWRVAAAIDVDDYPAAEPSSFVVGLCRAALEKDGAVRWNDPSSLPEQPRQGESFRNCVAAPVVLRGDLSGVVIIADKAAGAFTEEDTEVLMSVGSHAAVAIENTRLQREIQESYLSIVTVLAATMAARSQHAGRFEESGSRLAGLVAERLGLSEYERSVVYYSALLHDIGNVGVSDGVLNKPGPLLDVEHELIRAHTQIGHDLVREIPVLDAVAGIVRHHHERYDGKGYPDGLKGDAIPVAARIVAVVDAYGAMLAPRSYRPALTHEQACDQLRQGAGSQFDPEVVDAFLTVLETTEVRPARSTTRAMDVALPGLDPHHATPTGAGSF
jgi:HD-GYP domain-containing protein (c-di-GMP phosphodiesterase class II)